jgi:hypothetical protein
MACLVSASIYDFNEIGELCWDSAHKNDLLTVTEDGPTIEWDENKNNEDEIAPSWLPAED